MAGEHTDEQDAGTDRGAAVDAVNRYAYALDARDWPLLNEVFTSDAVARYAGVNGPAVEGRAAIVAAIRASLGGCGPSQHLMGNHVAELDGDEARVVCKGRVYHRGAGGRSALEPYEVFGVYRNRLIRTPGGWRIRELALDIDLTVGDPDVLQPG